ncbi:hypothetical protein [Paraliomyxa miuraensis]|uniref:hypothetical protein n=1 Tax=Paraliomyxa miuraensis TaxID=376150 RepID=UPI00225503F2|nr:hypothetical protein [Paraliomyxa miuraensis]MCX4244552.1 hypothetical protein [Paraliomyxa miuraensis]
MTTSARSARPGAVVAFSAVLAAACVIPDAGIEVEDEFLNPGAVRIVEPTPITPRADDDCDERTSLRACPNIPDTLPSGLIRPAQPLCICPSGERNPFGAGFDLFVEDPDVDDENNPKDEILGALLLDIPLDAEDPRDFLAYPNLLLPDEPARRYRAADVPTIERPDPHLKSWPLAPLGDLDLCNDNGGDPVGDGLHELRLIVTDRPWYRPAMLDASGEPVYDENGEVMFHDPVFGMPDLRAGATYDTATYVFRCYDPSLGTLPEGIECNCES